MSLELGQLPFRPDTTPYRSPEARRRRRKRDRLAAKAAAGLPVAPLRRITTHSGLEGDTFSTCGQLSIMPHALAPTDVDFQLGATQDRMGRSFAAAAVSHVVGVGLILLLISLSPERVYDIVEPNREHYGLVWLPAEGPGGGGGGGGNQSLEAPRQVELEGPDESALSVPVEPESDYVEPELQEETLQTQRLNIPAVSISSAPQTTPGVLEGFSARATLSQGSGTGGGGGTGEGTGAGPGIGPGLGPGQGGGVGGDLYRPGSGVSVPQVINRATPEYTSWYPLR